MSLPTETDPAKNPDDEITLDRDGYDPDTEDRAPVRRDADPDDREPDRDGVSRHPDESDDIEEEELAYEDITEIEDDDTELRDERPDA